MIEKGKSAIIKRNWENPRVTVIPFKRTFGGDMNFTYEGGNYDYQS
jgi:hypothetical protein